MDKTALTDRERTIEQIRLAFAAHVFPGDYFLQGSFEGSEPAEEIDPFKSQKDWQVIDADFLDAHASALSFFSEAGFRFYLPAYLIADLNDQLKIADPLFHLIHGFSDIAVEAPVKGRVFTIRSGKSVFVNPRRYGALTFFDCARYRLSIFTREEASAIVAYLRFKRDFDPDTYDKAGIGAALKLFWLDRAQTAPPAEDLRKYIADQEAYLAAIRSDSLPSGGER